MLASRQFPSPEAFVADFMTSLTPGIIPRSDFIQWQTIGQKVAELRPHVEFHSELAARMQQGAEFSAELADSLLASDQPQLLVKCAFELLGHTNLEFVTKQDDVNVESLAGAIAAGDENKARAFAELLKDLGFPSLLSRNDLGDLLFGVQIGLETHRRKNVGGDAFREEIANLLEGIATRLAAAGQTVQVVAEETIRCGNGLSKKVDFAIHRQGQTRFGVEVNFYTVSGSKPTEIKRSYGDLLRRLNQNGIELIWITDGKGYRAMQRSLRDAYVIMPNIYNLTRASQHLQNDLQAALN